MTETKIFTETNIDRLSVNSQGNEGNNFSINPSISADGRYIAFESSASNLVIGDTNNLPDIFIADRQSQTTSIISVNSFGEGGNLSSFNPSVSGDGRFVVFESNATNLVEGDSNNTTDIFLRDTLTATTTLVSVDSFGDRGNAASVNPSISADGRFIVFESDATNLVAGDTNNARDIFLRDALTETTTKISIDSLCNTANLSSFNPVISADGRFIAFDSFAANLVEGDTNNTRDIFVRDRETGIVSLVSGNSSSITPSISADGRFIAFDSRATNLISGDTNDARDIFMRDLQAGTTTRVSVDAFGNEATRSSFKPAISGDGRFVAFDSFDPLLVPGDSNGTNDIFLRDLLNGTTTRISVNSQGLGGNLTSFNPAISASGEVVAFDSFATNLVEEDTNNNRDVFVWSQNLVIAGGESSDRLFGGVGGDRLFGNRGEDFLDGGEGDDLLFGGQENDTLLGSDGGDVISGDFGEDILTGGSGGDRFILEREKGRDTIVDFEDGEDIFLLGGGLVYEDLRIDSLGDRAVISVASSDEILADLIGVPVNVLGAEDFALL
ncbi:MAG: calcium-binding protein [Okeania sp. SIO2H7]|nr:calcium-binding protein [Okeania sp. SIO2H7]